MNFNRDRPPRDARRPRFALKSAIKTASALLVLSALTVQSAAAFTTGPAVAKSPLDTREYRLLRLDNGLKVLLVSDPDADKAAASLDLNIGSGSDPRGWNGLAHFLEHMLFLGTEKYPQAGEYQKYIGDHGGTTNAFTSFSHTNYHFEVSAAHLVTALDRFAQFFIAPTFDATFVERERAVVHSEYQARLKDEFRRLWSVRRRALNPAHPGSRFTTGSAHTLRDRDGVSVRDQLIAFYNRHYSANLMTLAVIGKEPLIQLEHWVTRLFSAIPNRRATAERFEMPYIAPQRLPARLDGRAQQEHMRVSFAFPVASTRAHYRSKPLAYVAGLVGDEGRGSLLAHLKARGWARGLSAGAGYMDAVQGIFEVSIELTGAGLRHIDEIGALLFRYIALVATDGVENWRHQEARKLAEIGFRFAEDYSPVARARSLAGRLHRYAGEDVLRGPYRLEQYRPDLIRDLLADLRPDNVLVQVTSKDARTHAATPFYDVDYALEPLPEATLERWRNAAKAPADALALPPPNPFIPERLTPHNLPAEPHTIVVPRRLGVPGGVDAWYNGDPDFGTPRAAFLISVESPLANDSARNLVLTSLLVKMVQRRLDAISYPAHLAGLNYNLYRHRRGFSIHLTGYEDKQPVLLAVVLEALFERRFDADELTLTVAELKRKWNNSALEAPSAQGAREIHRLLLSPDWSEVERLAVIDAISVADLQAHAADLLEKVAVTTLSHGDVTRARALEMNQLVGEAFSGLILRQGGQAPPRVRRLPDERIYLRSLDVDHDDSSLLMYFQGHNKSDAERARMHLLARLIQAPFFFDLRTTHRVGYIVHASPWEILDVPGLLFSVQSPSHTPVQIERLVRAFLEQFQRILEDLDEGDFEQVKAGLMERLRARDQQLSERSFRFWGEIARRKFDFASRWRLIQQLYDISRDDMRAYFQRVIQTHPRQLLVQSPGRRPQAAGQGLGGGAYTRTGDPVEFRQSARHFFPPY